MVTFKLLLKHNAVRIFEDFHDDEGMGFFYDDFGTALTIDYENHCVYVEDEQGEHTYKFEQMLVD